MTLALLLLVSSAGTDWPIQPTEMSLQANGGWGNTHEKTHGVNSQLRNSLGGDCFYLMWGRCAQFQKLRSPRIRQVSAQVKMRGDVAWYLTGSPAWDDTPMYLFDELISYTNGAHDAWNSNKSDNHATVQYALEFAHYTAVLVQMIPASYPDRQRVAKFWCWNALRLVMIAKRVKDSRHFLYRSSSDRWYTQMEADWQQIVRIANGE